MSLEKTTEAARGRWREILLRFGVGEEYLKDEHGPCPICKGGKDRFRWDNKDGSGSFYCSQCGPGTGMRLLMEHKGWDFSRAAREVDAILGTVHFDRVKAQRSEADKRMSMRRVWTAGQKLLQGLPAWEYLTSRCGDISDVMGDLRYHPALRYAPDTPDQLPAMLALMRYPDGSGASIHRTYLTPDGRKTERDPARKIMNGFPLEGSAVRLGPAAERMGIAEGIETAICASHLFGMPVWSAISANGIKSWVPPAEARSIVIFGDNDSLKNYEGQIAAFGKAKELVLKGLHVEVEIPNVPGQDWADVWAERHRLEGVA